MTTPGSDPADPLAAALRRLDELIDWERRDRGAMRPGLDSMQDLAARIGDPQGRFRAVHVAGTKGKGSVSALVAEGLSRAGLSVGTYASPHVQRVTERVRLGGVEVDGETLAKALEVALAAREAGLEAGTPAGRATWFDLFTAAAFRIFAAAGVDWAVVECGLGGRLDSTNVVDADVSVITNVDLEHTAVLGTTRARIAGEKAGILKPGAVLVTGVRPDPELGGEEDASAVVEAAAARLGVPIRRPEVRAGATIAERNADLAAEILDALGERGVVARDARPVGGGLLDAEARERARLPGRMELLNGPGDVPVVIDGAHTPASVAAVLAELSGWEGLSGPPVVVLALGRDKDAAGVLKALTGRVDRLICTTVAAGPLRPPESLADLARPLISDVSTAPDAALALDAALCGAAGGGWVLAVGSLYLAGAIRTAIHSTTSTGPR